MKLSDLKRLCDSATPGPWSSVASANIRNADDEWLPATKADEQFIAAARNLMPKLFRVAEAARSVASEEAVKEQLLCYNMGCKLLEALADLEADE